MSYRNRRLWSLQHAVVALTLGVLVSDSVVRIFGRLVFVILHVKSSADGEQATDESLPLVTCSTASRKPRIVGIQQANETLSWFHTGK